MYSPAPLLIAVATAACTVGPTTRAAFETAGAANAGIGGYSCLLSVYLFLSRLSVFLPLSVEVLLCAPGNHLRSSPLCIFTPLGVCAPLSDCTYLSLRLPSSVFFIYPPSVPPSLLASDRAMPEPSYEHVRYRPTQSIVHHGTGEHSTGRTAAHSTTNHITATRTFKTTAAGPSTALRMASFFFFCCRSTRSQDVGFDGRPSKRQEGGGGRLCFLFAVVILPLTTHPF